MVLLDAAPAEGPSKDDYVRDHLNRSVIAGCVALCNARPEDPITFLANWLRDNKPTAPVTNVAEREMAESYADAVVNLAIAQHVASAEGVNDGQDMLRPPAPDVLSMYPAEPGKLHRAALLKQVFETVDVDGDGEITLAEFSMMFDTAGAIDDDVRARFGKMDVDSDGSITLVEFVTHKLDDAKFDDDGLFEAMQDGMMSMVRENLAP